MKDKIEAKIKNLEEANIKRAKDIAMHGQMKEGLINEFIETQGAIKELKELIGIKNPKGGEKK